MNAFRERRARIRLNFVQQFAKKSTKPNWWRMGYDLPELSEEARNQPFKVSTPDTSSLPQALTGDGEKLKAIQTALSTLEVPQSLRAKHHHKDPYENFAQLQKWADPNLPDPAGNSYNQQYTIGDLKKLFGAT